MNGLRFEVNRSYEQVHILRILTLCAFYIRVINVVVRLHSMEVQMSLTDPRPRGKRCTRELFTDTAKGLGHKRADALRLWPLVVKVVKGKRPAKDDTKVYVTVGQLKDKVVDGDRQTLAPSVSPGSWTLIQDTAKELTAEL